jgi:hypothetical protein
MEKFIGQFFGPGVASRELDYWGKWDSKEENHLQILLIHTFQMNFFIILRGEFKTEMAVLLKQLYVGMDLLVLCRGFENKP